MAAIMQRRLFSLALCSIALSPNLFAASQRGPLFWLITRGKGRVFLMGFGDAKVGDDSWFTPTIRHAFDISSELWLEVAPREAQANMDPDAKAKADAEYQQLSHALPDRTFFDELQPSVRQRLLPYMTELGIKNETLEPLRPWAAYYKINGAYWSHRKLSYEPTNVDLLLWNKARDAGKSFGYETPTGVAFAQFMAAMPEKAQSQYIEFLLNFLDDEKKGLLADGFEWEAGSPDASMRSLNRMRKELPDLYQVMQVQRNQWWAHKIDELLKTDKTCFIAMGQMHVLGPDGIPNQLRKLHIVSPNEIQENPRNKF